MVSFSDHAIIIADVDVDATINDDADAIINADAERTFNTFDNNFLRTADSNGYVSVLSANNSNNVVLDDRGLKETSLWRGEKDWRFNDCIGFGEKFVYILACCNFHFEAACDDIGYCYCCGTNYGTQGSLAQQCCSCLSPTVCCCFPCCLLAVGGCGYMTRFVCFRLCICYWKEGPIE